MDAFLNDDAHDGVPTRESDRMISQPGLEPADLLSLWKWEGVYAPPSRGMINKSLCLQSEQMPELKLLSFSDIGWFDSQSIPDQLGSHLLDNQDPNNLYQLKPFPTFTLPSRPFHTLQAHAEEDYSNFGNVLAPLSVDIDPSWGLMPGFNSGIDPRINLPSPTLDALWDPRNNCPVPPVQPTCYSVDTQCVTPGPLSPSLPFSFLPHSPQILPPSGAPITNEHEIFSNSNISVGTPCGTLPQEPTTKARIPRRYQSFRTPNIRPSKWRNGTNVPDPTTAHKNVREPGRNTGAVGVPTSHLNVFYSKPTRKERRKKTNNSCLNCMWNHRGCSGPETIPCYNCSVAKRKPGVPRTLCIRINLVELNFFHGSSVPHGQEYGVVKPSYTGLVNELDEIWPCVFPELNEADACVRQLVQAYGCTNFATILSFFQSPVTARLRHIITFVLAFHRRVILHKYRDTNQTDRIPEIYTAFARYCLADLQMRIKHISKLGLSELLDLLFHLTCLRKLLDIGLGWVGVKPHVRAMRRHLLALCRAVLSKCRQRTKAEVNLECAQFRWRVLVMEKLLDRTYVDEEDEDDGDDECYVCLLRAGKLVM